MEINNIGSNAGVIWNTLNANGKMTETKLKKESGLSSAEFVKQFFISLQTHQVKTLPTLHC